MSDRRSHRQPRSIEQSGSSNRQSSFQENMLQRQAIEVQQEQREQMDRALSSSMFDNPDYIIKFFSQREAGNPQDKCQVQISLLHEEVDASRNDYDKIVAIGKLLNFQEQLNKSRYEVYKSAKERPEKRRIKSSWIYQNNLRISNAWT